jgi:hypothetical protein
MFASRGSSAGSSFLRRAALLAIIAVTLGMPAAARARAGEPRRVLILNSYHPGYQWTAESESGLTRAPVTPQWWGR